MSASAGSSRRSSSSYSRNQLLGAFERFVHESRVYAQSDTHAAAVPDVLIFADTVVSPEMRHEVPFVVPDPFLYAEKDGERHVVLDVVRGRPDRRGGHRGRTRGRSSATTT